MEEKEAVLRNDWCHAAGATTEGGGGGGGGDGEGGGGGGGGGGGKGFGSEGRKKRVRLLGNYKEGKGKMLS